MLVRTSPKVLPWKHAFWLFLALNVADMLTTAIGILFLHLHEGNLLIVDQAGNFIWWRVILLKMNVIVVFAAFTYILFSYRHTRVAYYVAVVLSCTIIALVVLWNIFLSVYAFLFRA